MNWRMRTRFKIWRITPTGPGVAAATTWRVYDRTTHVTYGTGTWDQAMAIVSEVLWSEARAPALANPARLTWGERSLSPATI